MIRTVKIYTLVLALITSACLVFAFEANNRAASAIRQRVEWQAEVALADATSRDRPTQNRARARRTPHADLGRAGLPHHCTIDLRQAQKRLRNTFTTPQEIQ